MKKTSVTLLGILTFLVGATASGQSEKKSTVGRTYTLQPLDVIEVSVFREPNLTKEVRISGRGNVTLHLLGTVRIGGLTVTDAEQRITQLYNRDYLVDPQVTLTVLDYTQHRVNVTGSVNNPGPVVIPPEEQMTLSMAITAAGGINRLGNENRVQLTRRLSNGRVSTSDHDLDDIRDGRESDVILQDGDSIFVDEDII